MNDQERQDLLRQLSNSISDLTAYVNMKPEPKDAEDYRWTIKVQEIALAALTAEPVKVPDEPTGGDAPSHLDEYEASCWVAGACWMRGKMLGHPDAIDNTAQQYEALAGWKMVPIEPSKEMRSQIHPIADGNCSHCGNRTTLDCEENMLLSWRDMLEAAPKPEV